ncbi:class I SAM-dependent methyltransferase [Flavivirga algicola]|uniref:Class I SAM-dependent methyltransferase n=1 Tax=Flavivirga algicola TaxID=2729136 RepID=A0ABX1RXY4_9FLAO|nr:class I SAM-dependent methyltransferase [Flavivirga algicola]NMH87339.1 class I SAM-dependent methyltransferase [Flavivirga algicola]
MKLSRNFTNIFNWILDNLIPPFFRDSRIITTPFFLLLFGKKYHRFMDFKENVLNLNSEEIIEYYKELSTYHINRKTDLNKKSIDFILNNIEGESVLDISCGSGFLAKEIVQKHNINVVGVDFIISEAIKTSENPKFIESSIEKIPFPDNHFDTVISTHTLEHVVDIHLAIRELRRVCRKKIIIVLPRQRNYKFTFDLHIHFFPYKYSVLSMMNNKGTCFNLQNDWIYFENK